MEQESSRLDSSAGWSSLLPEGCPPRKSVVTVSKRVKGGMVVEQLAAKGRTCEAEGPGYGGKRRGERLFVGALFASLVGGRWSGDGSEKERPSGQKRGRNQGSRWLLKEAVLADASSKWLKVRTNPPLRPGRAGAHSDRD